MKHAIPSPRRNIAIKHPHRGVPGRVSLLVVLIVSGLVVIPRATHTGHGAAVGSTYFVSRTGNDGNAGTSRAAPWKTTTRVNHLHVRPGDRILFQGGATFRGILSFGASDAGSSTHPVVVSSYGRGRATLHAGPDTGLSIHNTAGIEISNLNVLGSGRTTNTKSGITLSTDLPRARLRHIRIDRVNVSGFGAAGIDIQGNPGKKVGFSDIRITNANVFDNADAGIRSVGYFDASSRSYSHQNIYVGYSRVHDNPGIPLTFGNSGNGIVLSDVNKATIEYCEVYNNGANNTANGGPVGVWTWSSNNVTIQHNESHHNHTNSSTDGGGFDLDGGATNSVVQYNYSHDNDGAGYLVAQFSGSRRLQNDTIRYNISQNDGRKNSYSGITFYNVENGINNIQVYNNTVYMDRAKTGSPSAIKVESPVRNVSVRDNIFVTTRGLKLLEVVAGQQNVSFQGNDYWSSPVPLTMSWGGRLYSSLRAWRAATGQERVGRTKVGLSVDPRLIDAGGGTTIGDPRRLKSLAPYKLRPASPMRDAGLNLRTRFGIAPGSHDFYGNRIPRGSGYAIGADEL